MAEFPGFVVPQPLDVDPADAAAPQPVELEMSLERSRLDQWCWAAIGKGIAHAYLNLTANEQCEIATVVHSQDPGNGGGVVCCVPHRTHPQDPCNQPHTVREPLASHHLQTLSDPDHRKPEFVREQIEAGHPIVVRQEFKEKKEAGHFVVIAGFVGDGEQMRLLVWDPNFDHDKPTPFLFTEFRDNFQSGACFWDQSYVTQQGAGAREKVPAKP